jgi:hypothetical protein
MPVIISRKSAPRKCRLPHLLLRSFSAICLLIFLLELRSVGQEKVDLEGLAGIEPNLQTTHQQLDVNWLYGAYVPKEAPLVPLTQQRREKLFIRQTFTTPGIYIKSGFLALLAQARGEPYEWGGGLEGYSRRLTSNYARTAIQNVFSTAGNAALRYEPRYDRCRCIGLGPRTEHALLRNFLTYNRTEKELRFQLPLYGAALGAGMLSTAWEPHGNLWKEGYEGILTQAAFGMLSNWVGEFAPEIRSQLVRKRAPALDSPR